MFVAVVRSSMHPTSLQPFQVMYKLTIIFHAQLYMYKNENKNMLHLCIHKRVEKASLTALSM